MKPSGKRGARCGHLMSVLLSNIIMVFLTVWWTHVYWHSSVHFQPDSLSRESGSLSQPSADCATLERRAMAEEEACPQPAAVNETLLGPRWRCTLLRDSCLDQGRILIHTGQKTPGHHNYTREPLFKSTTYPGYVLPGIPEPLGIHYYPLTYGLDIRAPTPLDPPDVWKPRGFNNCTVPLIFWPHYFSIYGTFFTRRVTPFFRMREDGVFDDSVLFAPDSNGMDLPAYYQTHLAPFTRHKVESLASLSSRERIQEGRSRCFSKLLLCKLGERREDTNYKEYKQAARKIVDFYKAKQPEKFEPVKDKVFRVAFFKRSRGDRKIVNQEEVLDKCNKWKLPRGSKYKSVQCYLLDDFPEDALVDSLSQLERVTALVSMHGSGMANSFFLPNNSAVVELMCSNFCGYWPNMYYRYGMEDDQSMNTGYFRLRADKDHCYPGSYERSKKGTRIGYARDQDIRVEFDVLAKALSKIALGKIKSTRKNFEKERVFNMTKPGQCI